MKIDAQLDGQPNAELKATCLILETALELIASERPGIGPEAIHNWLQASDDQPFPNAE